MCCVMTLTETANAGNMNDYFPADTIRTLIGKLVYLRAFPAKNAQTPHPVRGIKKLPALRRDSQAITRPSAKGSSNRRHV